MSALEPTFQQAMEIAASWLQQWDGEEISDEVLADRVAELVASRDGARGFFVVSLAGDGALMDRLPEPLVIKLRDAGAGVVDLTARQRPYRSPPAPATAQTPGAPGSPHRGATEPSAQP